MKSIAVNNASEVARSAHQRRVPDGALSAIAGILLFMASRKLAWGRDQSLADLPIWALASIPYMAYTGVQYSPWAKFAQIMKRSDFLFVWVASLMVFVAMRASGLASFYEDGLYDSTVPGILRYASLSLIYVSSGFAVVLISHAATGRTDKEPSFLLKLTGLAAAFLMFCPGIFLISP